MRHGLPESLESMSMAAYNLSPTETLVEQKHSSPIDVVVLGAATRAHPEPASLRELFAQAQIAEDLERVEELLLARTASRSPLISAASLHTIRAGGKRLRAALVLLAGQLATYSLDKVIHPAASAELIHAASLVHDDLVDQASQRRGHVTVHARWDNDVALMVGDYFFALAAGEMALSPDPRIITFYAQAVQTIVEGELSPVTVVEPFHVAYAQYMYKTGCKTAALFEAACKAGITATGGSPEQIDALGQFGYNVGVAFQIMDDVLDFVGDERTLGKPAGNDLRQGTITLPLIHAVAHGGGELLKQIVSTLHPADRDVQAAVEEVLQRDGVALAVADAEQYVQQGLTHLEGFAQAGARHSLERIARFILARSS